MPAIPWRGNCPPPWFLRFPKFFFELPKDRLRRGNALQLPDIRRHLVVYCSVGLALISGIRRAIITKI
jgi:hypothetical protein